MERLFISFNAFVEHGETKLSIQYREKNKPLVKVTKEISLSGKEAAKLTDFINNFVTEKGE